MAKESKLQNYRNQIKRFEQHAHDCKEDRNSVEFYVSALQGVAREIKESAWQPQYRQEAREVQGEALSAADRVYDELVRPFYQSQ